MFVLLELNESLLLVKKKFGTICCLRLDSV